MMNVFQGGLQCGERLALAEKRKPVLSNRGAGLKAEKLNKKILAYPTRLYNLVEHIEGGAVKY